MLVNLFAPTFSPSFSVSCVGPRKLSRNLITQASLPSGWLVDSVNKRYQLNNQFSSVAQSCVTLRDPMNCSTPGLAVHHQLLELTQTHIQRVSDAIPPSYALSSPFLLPPIPPSIRVFSNESTLHMRWPKYWSFSFSTIPSKGDPGLISFRMDWLDLLAV